MELNDLTNQVNDWCRDFERDGYLALSKYFPSAAIDKVLAATEEALNSRGMEIVVDSVITGERSFFAMAEHQETRLFKFNDLYLQLEEVRSLALEQRLTTLLRALLGGRSPVLCNSLTFVKGSCQPMHIDSLYMTPQTPQHLLATWTAFEDVHPGAGPLVYYPGSHKIPLYRFKDGTNHATNDEMSLWNEYIGAQLREREIEPQTFLARKGDLFIWHSDLVHSGSVINDPNATRQSLVSHYFTEEDCRRMPGLSLQRLHEGFWLDRFPPPVNAPPERFDAAHPFPETSYLRRHPDVAKAIHDGILASGYEHYCSHGYREGRPI